MVACETRPPLHLLLPPLSPLAGLSGVRAPKYLKDEDVLPIVNAAIKRGSR